MGLFQVASSPPRDDRWALIAFSMRHLRQEVSAVTARGVIMNEPQSERIFTTAEIRVLSEKCEHPSQLTLKDLHQISILLRDFALFIEFVGWKTPQKPH
jgi:hypothetical protein